ncbi:MAG: hypothetical protein GX663_04465 [Clostridiales bacterium]|nr:hypothetical protein [Clostridiales bacterium]
MKSDLTFVTGFFGAPVMKMARTLAAEKKLPCISLDDEIQKSDGRSVRNICMIMGEHEYRNKEYEALLRIEEDSESGIAWSGAVIACSDGVLLDEMSRDIILKYKLIILGADQTKEGLWQGANSIENPCHAFMYHTDEDRRTQAFSDLYERQLAFFKKYI